MRPSTGRMSCGSLPRRRGRGWPARPTTWSRTRSASWWCRPRPPRRSSPPRRTRSASRSAPYSKPAVTRSAMRRTVAALRAGGVPEELQGLAALPTLLDSVRGAGLPVTVLMVWAAPIELPPEVDASTYQVLREALTNALRHSDHTGVTVRVSYEPQAVDVTVLDVGRPVARGLPGGHGLAGLNGSPPSVAGSTPGLDVHR